MDSFCIIAILARAQKLDDNDRNYDCPGEKTNTD